MAIDKEDREFFAALMRNVSGEIKSIRDEQSDMRDEFRAKFSDLQTEIVKAQTSSINAVQRANESEKHVKDLISQCREDSPKRAEGIAEMAIDEFRKEQKDEIESAVALGIRKAMPRTTVRNILSVAVSFVIIGVFLFAGFWQYQTFSKEITELKKEVKEGTNNAKRESGYTPQNP